MAGIRSWIVATSSLAGVVRIAKVRTHSPFGFFQFSQMPAMPLVSRGGGRSHLVLSARLPDV
jgi:hypothetical protein